MRGVQVKYNLQLNVTPAQARLLIEALDLRVRIGIGQIEAVAEAIGHPTDYDEIRNHLFAVKRILGHPANGSHGIANPQISPTTKTSYDLMKAIQKGVATAEDHASFSVWHDGDILHLGTEPTARVAIVRGGLCKEVAVARHQRTQGD